MGGIPYYLSLLDEEFSYTQNIDNPFFKKRAELWDEFNFIRFINGGNVINIDTGDYEIEGKNGKWYSTNEMILEGNFFYLMENQKYHQDAAAVILDTYGKINVEDEKE